MFDSRSNILGIILVILLVVIIVAILWNFSFAFSNTSEKFGDLNAAALKKAETELTSSEKLRDAPEQGIYKLIIYHWDQCGHCKHLVGEEGTTSGTIYHDLVDYYADQPNIKILKFCYSRNKAKHEPETDKFNSFPTIVFTTLVNKNGKLTEFQKEYNGDRSLQSFKDFVTTAASEAERMQ